MQHLLFDVAFLGDFSQISRRIDVPLCPVRINLFDAEVQMFSRCSCSCVAGSTELLARLYHIACLYGNFAKVHVGTLYLTAVRTGVFHCQ